MALGLKIGAALLGVALAITGGTTAAQTTSYYDRVPIDAGFDAFTIRNSDGDRVNIHSRIDEVDGVYVVCLATTGVPNEDHDELMQYLEVLLNNQVILRGAKWAPHYRSTNGRRAVCHKTRAAITATPNFQFDWQQYDF